MDNTDFITILAWMKHLKASLVEKMVFAIIYGFSKDRRSDFRGSRQYLADWCECSTKTIDRALASLCDAGYIIKREEVVKEVKFCHYTVNFDTLDKMSIPWTKCPGGGEILTETEDKMSHNNIEDNITDNNAATTRTREVADAPQPISKTKFSYRDKLIAAGVSPENADRLMANRKAGKYDNTERAFNRLLRSLEQVCNARGVTYDEAIEYAGKHGWAFIDPGWHLEGLTAKRKRTAEVKPIGEIMQRDLSHYAN